MKHISAILVAIVLIACFFSFFYKSEEEKKRISYSSYVKLVEKGKVNKTIIDEQSVIVEFEIIDVDEKGKDIIKKYQTTRRDRSSECNKLINLLKENNTDYVIKESSPSLFDLILAIFPVILFDIISKLLVAITPIFLLIFIIFFIIKKSKKKSN